MVQPLQRRDIGRGSIDERGIVSEPPLRCVVVEVVNRYEVYVEAETPNDALTKADRLDIDWVEKHGDMISSASEALYAKD
jgi:hypothetical protein